MHALLAQLLEDAPKSKAVELEGFPTLHVWRVPPERFIEVKDLLPKTEPGVETTESDLMPFLKALLAISLGDEKGPGAFDCAEGREFINGLSIYAYNKLMPVLLEVTEALGPSEARKKKYATR